MEQIGMRDVQSSSISDIKQALCEHGPPAVGVASTRLFQAYVGGCLS